MKGIQALLHDYQSYARQRFQAFTTLFLGCLAFNLGNHFALQYLVVDLYMKRPVSVPIMMVCIGLWVLGLCCLFRTIYLVAQRNAFQKRKVLWCLFAYLGVTLVLSLMYGFLAEFLFYFTALGYEGMQATVFVLSTYSQWVLKVLFLYSVMRVIRQQSFAFDKGVLWIPIVYGIALYTVALCLVGWFPFLREIFMVLDAWLIVSVSIYLGVEV